MPLGSILSGVGMALSGIGSSRQAGASRRQTERWNRINQENWRRQFEEGVQTRVKDAELAGVSPLAALGISGTSLPSFQTGRSGGNKKAGVAAAFEAAGIAISEAQARKLNAEARAANAEARERDFKIREKALAVDQMLAMAQAAELRRRANRTGEARAQVAEDVPRGTPMYELYRDNSDDFGSLGEGELLVPNEQLAESGEGTLGVALTLGQLPGKAIDTVKGWGANRGKSLFVGKRTLLNELRGKDVYYIPRKKRTTRFYRGRRRSFWR